MDIRPELGRKNPSWFGDFSHLDRGRKDYSNSNWTWDMYGNSPELYKENLDDAKERADDPIRHTWQDEDGNMLDRSRMVPKTQDEIDWDKDEVERWLDMNNRMAHDDPHSPIQRMNQPMGAFTTDWNWKNRDGDYFPAQSFSNALLDDKTGGSFKDTLNNQSDGVRQEWLNNHHGGRGLGYMGQNKFHRQPSAYGPGTTYNMDERKANVQANAIRFFKSRGFRV